MVRVLVTGDRNWCPRELARQVVVRLKVQYGDDLILIHGGATGADITLADAAGKAGIRCKSYPADWTAHGKGAGPRRNAEMVAAGADFALAFHRDVAGSRGTKDCCRRCLKAGIPVWLFDREDATGKRLSLEDLGSADAGPIDPGRPCVVCGHPATVKARKGNAPSLHHCVRCNIDFEVL